MCRQRLEEDAGNGVGDDRARLASRGSPVRPRRRTSRLQRRLCGARRRSRGRTAALLPYSTH